MNPLIKYNIEQLYQEDYSLWIEQTTQQLREQNADSLDWQHLAEEIEDLGKELKHKVDSYLKEIDWKVKENANMTYSLQGLNEYVGSYISKKYC
jgi:hypothetical protein